jgi:hypothetical protein
MSRAGDEIEVLPPKFDDGGNPLVVEEGSESGTSKTPTLEDLMKKLEKLKAENKKLKAMGKKGMIHQNPTYKRMTSDDVLGRIINHAIYIEVTNHIKNLYKLQGRLNHKEAENCSQG